MNSIEPWPDATSSDKQILALASLFDVEFSIDWVQELSKAKATIILTTFERASNEGLLEKKDLGIFYFEDPEIKEGIKSLIPRDQRHALHRKIAGLMINEASDSEQAILSAAGQLIHVTNDLEGCRILLDAGNRYREKRLSENALACYNKIIADLKCRDGRQEDILFVSTVIGYSKDRLSISTPETTLSLLEQALLRAEKLNDKSFQAIILLHLASVQYVRMQYASADNYFSRGKKIAREINDPVVERTLDTCSVVHYCFTGRYRDAVEKYESMESVFAKEPSDYKLSLKVSIVLGISYAHVGQIPQGLGMLYQLREDALALNDHDAAARASIFIAFVLMMKNDIENAALQIYETLKTSREMDLFTRAFADHLQAHIYLIKKDVKKSHYYLKKTVSARSKYSFALRGQLFEFCLAMMQGNYPKIPGLSLEDEIRTALELGNIYDRGVALRYRALMQYYNNDSPKSVLESFQKSLEYLEESGSPMEIARTKEVMGRYYLQQNDITKAREHVEAAAKTFQKIGARHKVSDDLSYLLKDFHIKEDLMEEILNFGPEVVEITDIKKVAQRILSTVIKITEAERGAIFMYPGQLENPGVELLASKNLAPEEMEKPDFELSTRMILASAKSGQVNLDNIDAAENELLTNDDIKSRICIPLLRRKETIGVLYHDNRLFQNTFKKQDLKVLTYFASLAAIALDNAHAYEKIQSLNQRLNEEKQYLEEQQLEHLHFEDFVAASPAIKEVLNMVERVADTETTVLILGDTGVGKEMVARAIHQQSSRSDKPFIRVNCSAFPESLIASELFGHEKGSFTGAAKRRIGRFELADTGTLFLDEIGDISMDIQVRLLRVLQTKKFERVGASESIRSDFRLLTATNRNLEKSVADGRFRQDLYYRLNVFPIYVPPLRERMEDISPLACHFLKKHADKMNKSFKGIAEIEMGKLLKYHWPGNVRELENVIERGVILNSEDLFIIPELTAERGESKVSGQFTLEEMERRYILDTLQLVNWKIYGPGGAAELLGLNHSTLYSRMKKLGIQNPNKK